MKNIFTLYDGRRRCRVLALNEEKGDFPFACGAEFIGCDRDLRLRFNPSRFTFHLPSFAHKSRFTEILLEVLSMRKIIEGRLTRSVAISKIKNYLVT